MSPEQATGRPIDARSDQFALGAILYEMVTGRRAFPGESAIEILTALVRDDPKPLEEAGIDVPAPLAWIIGRCLAKDPAERYGSTGDLAHDLCHVPERLSEEAAVRTKAGTSSGSGPAPRSIDSLAVLPFENASADSEAEYLSDGIAESLINALSSLRGLRVVPRSTVFRYKGTDRDPLSVGKELAVRAVLTGRVAQRGNLLTVQAELVDVAHHSQIWGVRYNRKVADILAVEEEISGEIAEKLRLELSGSEKQRLADRGTRDTEAYRLYLKGRFYWNKRTRAALEKAMEFFGQAIEADSRYALAYAGLAESQLLLCAFGAFSPQKAEAPIMAAAGKALELDGRLASAHTAIAFLRQLRWNWTGARDEFRRALELDPSDATTHNWYANHLAALGKFEEAIIEAKQAVELDPLSLTWNFGVGHMLYLARRYDEAIAQARRTIEMDEHYPFGYWLLGLAAEQKGETARWVASIEQADRLSGGFLFTTSLLGRAYAVTGRIEEAEEILDRFARRSENEYVSPAFLGLVQAALGDRDGAFESLRQSAEEGSYVLFFAKVSPIFDDLRDDPRFAKLLGKIGLKGG
jgi:TolB-like protein/Flp pilus assembly protein TadD